MSHEGYMCLGGMEIVNNDRVGAYALAGYKPTTVDVSACYSCGPDFAKALGQAGGKYSNPATDNAPWYSETESESIDFGGLLVMSVDGLGPGQFTKATTLRASGRGSFIGPGVQASPVIVVRGLLLGRTCCSVDYGLRWLSNVLRGTCGQECDGDDLEFLACCPEICEDGPDFVSFEACIAPYIRLMKGVSLLQSPTITNRYGSGCGCCPTNCALVEVEFRLGASEPCVFRPPTNVATEVPFDTAEVTPCPVWIPTPEGVDCTDADCAPADDCLLDASCPPAPSPPSPPAALNPCVCEPMGTVRACVNLPAAAIPEFADGVPIVTIKSGAADLRQVQMRFQLNPQGLDPDDLHPCEACGEVTLSHIPAGSVFVMDGTNNTVTITCPGSDPVDATSLLGSRGGRLPFRFPEITCGGVAYTMCVTADAATVAADASISLDIAIREC